MKARARKLRKEMTDVERLPWRHLRNRRLAGCKIRRRQIIGPYIIDFICFEKRIVIEVDGGRHGSQAEKNAERSKYLEARGYKILRF